jgi:hypothetical protein
MYRKLRHASLADQLGPYLRDTAHATGTKHVTISIARACQVPEVGPELPDIALDRSADLSLRVSAAATAAEVGSIEVRARLSGITWFGEKFLRQAERAFIEKEME